MRNTCKQSAKQVLYFSKWKRKNYSVFQSIRKVVLISVLSINYFWSVPTVAMVAKQDTIEITKEYGLDEIEVSAQRSPAVYSQVARIISVIERQEIEAAPARSIQELLEYVAGVDIRQRGAEGIQADVSIRGGTFDQTLILLNGINITDPQTGHHNLNIPVSFNEIQRIEILEGPAARVYGPNAFSGAINIVTRQTASNELNASLTGGSFGYFDADLAGSFHIAKMQNNLSVNYKQSEGYIANTDFKNAGVYYSGVFDLENGKMSLQAGYSDKGFGANSFYTPKYPNQYEEVKAFISSVKWESYSKFHVTPAVYWRRHQDRFELFRDNPASWYTTHNYHLTNTYGANLNSWVNWQLGKTACGIEFRSENILSNVLGDPLNEHVDVPGEDALFTKSKSRDYYSGFIEHVYNYNKWNFSAGVLVNYITENKTGFHFFPGFDIGYKITSDVKAFVSYNTSLRMPTFTDLYYSGPTNIGNPDLNPEISSTAEGGMKLNSGAFNGYVVGFYRKGKNIIDWVKMDNSEKWQPQNLTEINGFGGEFQFQANLKQYFGLHLPNRISVNYLFNTLNKEEFDFISYYVLDNLKHKFVGSVNQEIVKNFTIDLKVSFQFREGSYTSFKNGSWGSEIKYPSFWLFDGKLNYSLKKANVFASVTNIFNVGYYDIGNVAQPGRWFKAGVSYRFGL